MKHARPTTPFRDAHGNVIAGSIAEVSYLRLGGVDQWVMIRGEDRRNPALVLLHGGPGFNSTRLCRIYNASLETRFTVVYWDQRGTGRSFHPALPRSSMTVERFVADLDELVEAVRARLGQDRVVLFGHSWGSALGPLYASRFPSKVAAYVGCGQLGDWAASEEAAYAFTLAEAERQGNRKAVEELRQIGRPPYSAEALWTQRTWAQRLEGQLSPRSMLATARAFVGPAENSLFDLRDVLRGFRFSLDAMWDEVSRLDLMARVPELQMPLFLLLGRNDHWVAPKISRAFFQAVRAPRKEIVWFEHSGHEPFVDEPDAFNDVMLSLVRPAVD